MCESETKKEGCRQVGTEEGKGGGGNGKDEGRRCNKN